MKTGSKYRFSKPVIDFLLTLDYSSLTEEMIRSHIDALYKPLDSLSLEEISSLYSWFPKKNIIVTSKIHEGTPQFMMDQKSINAIIKVIQSSDLSLINTSFSPIKLSLNPTNNTTVRQEVQFVIADRIGFNSQAPLTEAWVANNILLFTVFDGYLENVYSLTEGASFRNHYDNIPSNTLIDQISKFCYRIMKLIRNAIQHNLSSVIYSPPAIQDGSMGSYSINYTHRGTIFSLDIDGKAVCCLYSLIVSLVTGKACDNAVTQGHYEGILNSMYEQVMKGITLLSDDIDVWQSASSAVSSASSVLNTAHSVASSSNPIPSSTPSTPSNSSTTTDSVGLGNTTWNRIKYDKSHLRFFQRYVVKDSLITIEDNDSYVVFKHLDQNGTDDESSVEYWRSTDYIYKGDWMLPQELGTINKGSGTNLLERIENATIRFEKSDMTDRWRILR